MAPMVAHLLRWRPMASRKPDDFERVTAVLARRRRMGDDFATAWALALRVLIRPIEDAREARERALTLLALEATAREWRFAYERKRPEPEAEPEPVRSVCPSCCGPVILAPVFAEPDRADPRLFVAEPYEWEPRAKCYLCAAVAERGLNRGKCARCNGTGYVGEDRPSEPMLAVDAAWSDTGHIRVVGPLTKRNPGEALYREHRCALAA